jgi:uncharacterized membrane protein (UPF0127 family)
MPELITHDALARVVCEWRVVADRPHTRLRGLFGRAQPEAGQEPLLKATPSVHTCFMRFPIDAVFLDAGMNVLSVNPELRPRRFAGRRGARAVLDLGAGEAERRGIRAGTPLNPRWEGDSDAF